MKLPEPVLTPEGARRRVLSYGGALMMVQFDFPAGVYASPGGEVFVVDLNNDRIQVWSY